MGLCLPSWTNKRPSFPTPKARLRFRDFRRGISPRKRFVSKLHRANAKLVINEHSIVLELPLNIKKNTHTHTRLHAQ